MHTVLLVYDHHKSIKVVYVRGEQKLEGAMHKRVKHEKIMGEINI